MAEKKTEMQTIQVRSAKGRIELGERYACALALHSRLEWRCDHPLAVSFDWAAPFTVRTIGKKRAVLKFKTGALLRPNCAYPYHIAVYDKGMVNSDVAVIIVKPPRPEPAPPPGKRFRPPFPDIIIVGQPRG